MKDLSSKEISDILEKWPIGVLNEPRTIRIVKDVVVTYMMWPEDIDGNKVKNVGEFWLDGQDPEECFPQIRLIEGDCFLGKLSCVFFWPISGNNIQICGEFRGKSVDSDGESFLGVPRDCYIIEGIPKEVEIAHWKFAEESVDDPNWCGEEDDEA